MQVDSDPIAFDYDLFVIGGGSGGISAARHAALLGKKVALADYVEPSPIGTKWGIGGTCVNVGCIPKKMMHYAACLGEARHDQELAGLAVDNKTPHDWGTMVGNVQMHIKSLNWGYKSDLLQIKVKYFNSYASFVDKNTIKLDNGKGKIQQVTADKIIIAVGGRPSYPGIEGDKEFGITSDDIFSLKKAPGKTLVVGASYVALECAGFLNGLGYDTTVAVRSILLRGFDQQMADKIGDFMYATGTKFIENTTPKKLTKEGDKIHVTLNSDGKEVVEEFDTVLFAMGRYAITAGINLAGAGVVAESNGKIKVNDQEQTNVSNIFAIGDVIYGNLELTPVAIKSGELLAKRLYDGKTQLMDYVNVPTAVFTPIEYGSVGLSEEDAIEQNGDDNIEVFHTSFTPLEWMYNKERPEGAQDCYVKLIVHIPTDKVLGFHILSPSAGEVTQAIGIAVKMGVTKEQMDSCIGIHPIIAEEIVGLTKTKRSDPNAQKSGC